MWPEMRDEDDFVCTGQQCGTVMEQDEPLAVCPQCGGAMQMIAEEELNGWQWCNLGIFWRLQNTEAGDARAVHCLTEAVKRGDSCARSNLGVCKQYGIGTVQDEAGAFQLYQQAAEEGYVPALYRLACCYEYGVGTAQSWSQALPDF